MGHGVVNNGAHGGGGNGVSAAGVSSRHSEPEKDIGSRIGFDDSDAEFLEDPTDDLGQEFNEGFDECPFADF